MDDKIKEVMGLVDAYLDSKIKNGSYTYNEKTYCARLAIETKLRELVQIPPGYALVPVELLSRVEASLDAFLSDYGWSQRDMDTADALSAMLAAAQKEPTE